MDSILIALNDWRQSTEFTAALPWLRVADLQAPIK